MSRCEEVQGYISIVLYIPFTRVVTEGISPLPWIATIKGFKFSWAFAFLNIYYLFVKMIFFL